MILTGAANQNLNLRMLCFVYSLQQKTDRIIENDNTSIVSGGVDLFQCSSFQCTSYNQLVKISSI